MYVILAQADQLSAGYFPEKKRYCVLWPSIAQVVFLYNVVSEECRQQ